MRGKGFTLDCPHFSYLNLLKLDKKRILFQHLIESLYTHRTVRCLCTRPSGACKVFPRIPPFLCGLCGTGPSGGQPPDRPVPLISVVQGLPTLLSLFGLALAPDNPVAFRSSGEGLGALSCGPALFSSHSFSPAPAPLLCPSTASRTVSGCALHRRPPPPLLVDAGPRLPCVLAAPGRPRATGPRVPTPPPCFSAPLARALAPPSSSSSTLAPSPSQSPMTFDSSPPLLLSSSLHYLGIQLF